MSGLILAALLAAAAANPPANPQIDYAGFRRLAGTVAAGGGIKVPIQRRLGLRLDGRVFTTFIDADSRAVACVSGTCLVGLDVNVAWQAEFTAAMVLVF